MPWFALTTLLHCILALERRLILTSWVVVLSIGTFTLSMCGTFLVRSGILNSVHTFANDPERGIFILVFLFSLIFLSIFIFIFFHKPDNKSQINFSWLSKEASILFNNWLMMYFLSVVLIGTVYPIFLDVISSEQISVGPPFYHRLIIPFLIPFLLIMAIGPKLSWISTNIKQKLNLIIFLVISFFLAGFIVVNLNVEFLINTILIGSSFYLFFLTLSDLFRNKLINISQNISHFGFSLLILSILFNNIFSSEIITNMKIGEVYKKDKIEINFQKIEQKKEKNFNSIIGTFNITDSENKRITLKPQLRIFNQPNIITSEADIKTTLFSDKFMVMNVVQNQEYFNIRYQIKPFMIWIWISVIIITLGGLVSFYRKI